MRKKINQAKLVEMLELVAQQKGLVYVAAGLGFRDSHTIWRWIKRKEIPRQRILAVNEFLQNED